jgi:hypothetical protein
MLGIYIKTVQSDLKLMEDQAWASAVSKRAWTKKIDTREPLFSPMETGEIEETPDCWSAISKRGRVCCRYFKVKAY